MILQGYLLIKQVKRRRKHLILGACSTREEGGLTEIPSQLTLERSLLEEYGLQKKYLKNGTLSFELKSRELEEIHVDRLRKNDLILDSLKTEEEFTHGAQYDLCRVQFRPSSRKTCLAHFLSVNLVPDYFSKKPPEIPGLSNSFYDLTLNVSEDESRQLQEQSEKPEEHHVFSFSFKLR